MGRKFSILPPMLKQIIAALLVALSLPSAVLAETPTLTKILIVELQTGQSTESGNDFVELYNPNNVEVDVTGWRLQYRTAAAESTATWTTKRTFACADGSPTGCKVTMLGHGRLVVATYDIPLVDEQRITSSGFAGAGGQIRLVLPSNQAANLQFEQDMLGYGNAVVAKGQPATAPPEDKSIKRLVTEDGHFVDTGNNAADFVLGCDQPTPGDTVEPVTEAPTPCTDPEPDPDPDPSPDPDPHPPATIEYLPLELSEILPDPDSPLKDDTDEFVEIYNPNDTAVNVKGYYLRTGSSLQNKVTFGEDTIAAKGYLAITSGESSLSLGNSGTAVQLFNPDNELLEEAPNYGKAQTGKSWIKDSSGWHWSASPTLAAANILTLPPSDPPKPTSPAPTKKATTTKKVAAAKTASTPKSSQPKEQPAPPQPAQEESSPFNYWIIVAIVAAAVGYGLFEYRRDIRQKLVVLAAKIRRK